MTNLKSSTVLEEELCQVKLQYGSDLPIYQQAYRDHDKARKWLKKKKNQEKSKELVEKYILMLAQNKEYAKKYKKVMNIESLIRKREKEEANYEAYYERFLHSLSRLPAEKRVQMMKIIPNPAERAAQQNSKWKIRADFPQVQRLRLGNTYGRRVEASIEKMPSKNAIRNGDVYGHSPLFSPVC